MPSEIEKLLTAQQTTTSQLELFNESKGTIEDLLLEQMITNEELESSKTIAKGDFGQMKNALIDLPNVIGANFPNLEFDDVQMVEVMNAEALKADDIQFEPVNLKLQALAVIMKDGFSKLLSSPAEPIIDMPQVPLLPPPTPLEVENVSSNLPAVVEAGQMGDTGAIMPDEILPATDVEDIVDSGMSSAKSLLNIDENIQKMTDIAVDNAKVVGSAGDLEGDKPNDEDSGELPGFGMFKGLGQKFGKFGKLAKGALKIGGAVLSSGLILADIYEGFTSDEKIKEISGKAKEDLTDAESSAVAIANVIEGLSFGLISAKDVFPDTVPIIQGLQDGIDQIFDPDIGALGTLTSGFMNGIGQIFEGDFSGGLSSIITGFTELPGRLFEVIGRWANEVLELLPQQIADEIKEKVAQVTDFVGGATDSVKSFFGFGDDEKEVKSEAKVKSPSNSALGFSSDEPDYSMSPAARDRQAFLMKQQPQGNNIAQPQSGIGSEGRQTVALSKERFEERNKPQEQSGSGQPIIINQQASEGKKIERRKSNPDMSLAFLNSGLADG
jgi:hypothetical protein